MGEEGGGAWRQLSQAWSIGLTFPASLAAGYLLGYWLDGLFGTSPKLAYGGFVLGIIAAFVHVYRVAASWSAEERKKP